MASSGTPARGYGSPARNRLSKLGWAGQSGPTWQLSTGEGMVKLRGTARSSWGRDHNTTHFRGPKLHTKGSVSTVGKPRATNAESPPAKRPCFLSSEAPNGMTDPGQVVGRSQPELDSVGRSARSGRALRSRVTRSQAPQRHSSAPPRGRTRQPPCCLGAQTHSGAQLSRDREGLWEGQRGEGRERKQG